VKHSNYQSLKLESTSDSVGFTSRRINEVDTESLLLVLWKIQKETYRRTRCCNHANWNL